MKKHILFKSLFYAAIAGSTTIIFWFVVESANYTSAVALYGRLGLGSISSGMFVPIFVLTLGLIVGVLLAGVFYFLSSSRAQAIAIAQDMTRDLQRRIEENEGIRKQLELSLGDIQTEHEITKALANRFDLATRSAKMGVWDWDVINNILVWDEQMYRLYGIRKEDFSGAFEAWQRVVHPKDVDRTNLGIDMALKGVKDLDIEFRVIWPDGHTHHIQAHALVQRDESGQAVRMIGVNWDVTQKHKVEQLLHDQKYALDQNAIVAITDVRGSIIYVNDKFCQISKYSHDELIGQNHRILKSGEHPPEFYGEMWRTIAQGKVWRGEVKNKAKDGSFYWVDAVIVPFLNDEKKPYQYMAIRNDITARKLAEAQLKESQQKLAEAIEVKSKFVAIVSHELRTPMAAIQEGINLVSDGSLGQLNAKQKQFLDLSRRNVERLSRLINDVLDFQKIQSNALEMNLSLQDLNEIIRDVHKMLVNLAEKKNLAFELDLQADLPKISLDHDKIIQVLTNLVNNALRHTDQGSIIIASSLKDGQVHVQVKDTGMGIRPEHINRLFVSFQQFGDENQRRGGTGLGLVISKEIILRHNGKIWVESQWGKGANFQFSLPVS